MTVESFLSPLIQLLCKEIVRVKHISDMYMFTASRRQSFSEESWQPLKICYCRSTSKIRIKYQTVCRRTELNCWFLESNQLYVKWQKYTSSVPLRLNTRSLGVRLPPLLMGRRQQINSNMDNPLTGTCLLANNWRPSPLLTSLHVPQHIWNKPVLCGGF